MTLENYISEAVSHGRRDFNRYIESIDVLMTIDDLTDLLGLIGYSESENGHGSITRVKDNCYTIKNDVYSDSTVQVEIMNKNKEDSFFLVCFGKHTKRIVRVESGHLENHFGTPVWEVKQSRISELIEYLK